ncbi:MAG: hypothetical protein IH820_01825 [Bacteroidetes bacterium]|nr:hypothetical protein [Bacteroidota bacterium]
MRTTMIALALGLAGAATLLPSNAPIGLHRELPLRHHPVRRGQRPRRPSSRGRGGEVNGKPFHVASDPESRASADRLDSDDKLSLTVG